MAWPGGVTTGIAHFVRFEYFVYPVPPEAGMSALISHRRPAEPHPDTAVMPDEHDQKLAASARRALTGLGRADHEVTLTVTDDGGKTSRARIPASALRLLLNASSEFADGNAVSLLPLHAELTTQEAADLLNVSRPYFVGLLEKRAMPHRKVGTQRRVRLQDVLAYKARLDADRRAALTELARLGQEIGVGYEA
jgi:excisionase family DNA binding protein